jgi:CRP-like cAMP-binding protein
MLRQDPAVALGTSPTVAAAVDGGCGLQQTRRTAHGVSSSPFFLYDGSRPGDDVEMVILPRLSEDGWRRLLAYVVRRNFSAGELVIREGDRDRSLHLVAEGTLQIAPRRGRPPLVVSAGSVIGEISFFDGLPRSADVRALSDGALATLSYEHLEVLAAREPALARELLLDLGRILARRLRRGESRGE